MVGLLLEVPVGVAALWIARRLVRALRAPRLAALPPALAATMALVVPPAPGAVSPTVVRITVVKGRPVGGI